MTVSNTTISGNTASNGGGIENFGIMTVSNSTITGNTASKDRTAGGIDDRAYARDATVQLLNSTISNNTVSSRDQTASQVLSRRVQTFQASVEFHNTIISGQGSRPTLFSVDGGAFTSKGHNLSSDGGSGFLTGQGDLTNTDPMLGPLQDNGGPTFTMALLPGSPAVDAGDNNGAPDFDQRGDGYARIVGGTVDMGAFEAQIGPAVSFAFGAPATIPAGQPFDVTVTALDAYGHIASGYTGTVTFAATDTDPGVVLPDAYTFTADDQGSHTFADDFTLITVGDQTLTLTDSAGGLSNSVTVTVTAPPPAPPRGPDGMGWPKVDWFFGSDTIRAQTLSQSEESSRRVSADGFFAALADERVGRTMDRLILDSLDRS